LIGDGGDAGISNCDSVEGLEIVYKAFLLHTKPSGSIQGVGVLIDSGGILVFENLDNIGQDVQGNGKVFVHPGNVLNNGYLNRREVLGDRDRWDS
jgi:hypothetical protein